MTGENNHHVDLGGQNCKWNMGYEGVTTTLVAILLVPVCEQLWLLHP